MRKLAQRLASTASSARPGLGEQRPVDDLRLTEVESRPAISAAGGGHCTSRFTGEGGERLQARRSGAVMALWSSLQTWKRPHSWS